MCTCRAYIKYDMHNSNICRKPYYKILFIILYPPSLYNNSMTCASLRSHIA